jgi:hypothetical protein
MKQVCFQLNPDDCATSPVALPSLGEIMEDFERAEKLAFPALKRNQYAGRGAEGWKAFDSLDEARKYAKGWVAVRIG